MPAYNDIPTWGALEGGPPAPVRSATTRTGVHVGALFEDAFQRLGGGEHITWDLLLQALPHPSDEGRWNPLVIVYAEIAALAPNQSCMVTSPPLPLNGWTENDADSVVSDLLGLLFKAREDEKEAMQQQTEAALRDGQPTPLGGPLH